MIGLHTPWSQPSNDHKPEYNAKAYEDGFVLDPSNILVVREVEAFPRIN